MKKTEDAIYQKIISSLKKRRQGATVADISAATALPLSDVREIMPQAADEFKGRLEVTESGEILYSFPNGFTSRYRGPLAALKRFWQKSKKYVVAASVFLFKVWIMFMLVGYFVLFIAIALAAVLLSIAAKSRSEGGYGGGDYGGRGGGFGINPFGLLWQWWFFSSLTQSASQQHYGRGPAPAAKVKSPMYKAIFSFVFGDGDPNKDWQETEDKAIISYIQENKGVISLGEYMAFCGKNSVQAEEALLAFCARFAGSPEATAEGTIVYRFDELLLRKDEKKSFGLSLPVQRLRKFSANPRSTNVKFAAVNGVNLLFGSYFLFHTVNTGLLTTQEQFEAASFLYAFTQMLAFHITANPLPVLGVFLGIIPLAFSAFFWIIPALRRYFEDKENDSIKLTNFKRLGFSRFWAKPLKVEPGIVKTDSEECRPRNLAAAWDGAVKDFGAVFPPDVELSEGGQTIYSFNDVVREKTALEKYRGEMDASRSKLGKTVFDSGERV
ncbi:MAG: hypothetical protein FWG66_10625 [Spirochaetes bacterium]|nr:hypothetical protein [Spirochaetota bacterium]